MRSVQGGPEHDEQLREVVAHLGTALDQSDYTDDQIIVGHIRSAHHLALDIVRSGRTSSDHSAPPIAPTSADENIYLVEDCLGSFGCVWREADVGKTDLETVVVDLMTGEYRDPRRVIAFNTAEHWSEDVSEDIAREIQRRSDLAYDDVPSAIQAFVDRHVRREKQLALRLV